MKKIILYISILSIAVVLICAILNQDFSAIILSITTSIIAAAIFYVFQVYIPDQKKCKFMKKIYSNNMKEIFKYINERVFFFEQIATEKGYKIDSKIVFAKMIDKNKSIFYTFFNYKRDTTFIIEKYNNLLNNFYEYCLIDNNFEGIELSLNNKFNNFFNFIFLFIENVTVSNISQDIISTEYKKKLKQFKDSMDYIKKDFQFEDDKVEYILLSKEEVKEYLNSFMNVSFKERIEMAQPFIYYAGVLPYIYFNQKWNRIIDINDEDIKRLIFDYNVK